MFGDIAVLAVHFFSCSSGYLFQIVKLLSVGTFQAVHPIDAGLFSVPNIRAKF